MEKITSITKSFGFSQCKKNQLFKQLQKNFKTFPCYLKILMVKKPEALNLFDYCIRNAKFL